MRGLTRRWILPGSSPSGDCDLLPRLLASRGLTEPDLIRRFCDPKLTDLHDPGLMPDIDRAASRLERAVRGGEQIVIYGDYDVDGMTATAILYHTIRATEPTAQVRWYVPHRLDEGYGVNAEAVRQLAAEGARVIVSVDCGVTAVESAEVAREVGVDLIITDHHNFPQGGELPPAYAIVHPRVPGSEYPYGELCGAGVAFKLAWQYAKTWCGSERVSKKMQQVLLDMLPLAALGTIADIVPLVDENRIIAAYGLRLMDRTPLPGLRALIDQTKLDGKQIDTEKVGFVLGPRLNACGRMGHAREAVHMLTDAPEHEAQSIAEHLNQMNEERRRTERTILDQALKMAEESGMTGDDGARIIVLSHPDWHPGVVGIVCSRLVDRFGRPAILMQEQDGVAKGSARSIPGYSIHRGLEVSSEHLLAFGGHDAAAGLTIELDKLDAFREAISAHARDHIAAEDMVPTVAIDCEAGFDELGLEDVKRLRTLAPFGRDNPKPTLLVEGTVIAEPPRAMGAHGKHLQMRLRQETSVGRRVIRAVWWNRGDMADRLVAGTPVDVLIEPKLNEWRGNVSVEAELRDVRIREGG